MPVDSTGISTVFIVDDESVIRDALCLIVQAMGVTVKCFSSAAEFIEFIESFDISGPVCLIADIQMPEISGIELLEQLGAMGRKLPAIIVTGHGDAAIERGAEELGAIAFFEKPFRPAELQNAIASILKIAYDESGTS